MCGRFSVSQQMNTLVSALFNTPFNTDSNSNFSPGQSAATIHATDHGFEQHDALWGIKPNWSKKRIINAQSESVAFKPTFQHAFNQQRCLVPCNGWFEWRNENGKKIKYFFEHADKLPLYMAGILFQGEHSELVTLTTHPNPKCSPFHKRMPVLVYPENTEQFLKAPAAQLAPLLLPVHQDIIHINKAN